MAVSLRFAAALLAASTLAAQQVSVGVRGGAPLTHWFTTPEGGASTRPYLVGPTIQVRLWHSVSLGADFLLGSAALGGATVRRWELPVTVHYSLRALSGRPFVRAGLAVNHIFSISGATVCGRGPFGEQFYCVDSVPLAELRHRGTWGPVAGAGFGFRVGKVRLEPEVRLTHWIERNFGVSDSAVRSRLTEVQILAGARF